MCTPSECVPGDKVCRCRCGKQFWIVVVALSFLAVAFLLVSLRTGDRTAVCEPDIFISLIGQPVENVGQVADTVEILGVPMDITLTERDGIFTGFTYTGKVLTADAAKILLPFYLNLADACGDRRFLTGDDCLRYENIRGFKNKEPREAVVRELLLNEDEIDLGLGWSIADRVDISWLAVEDPRRDQRRFDVILWLEGDTTDEYLTLRIDYQARVIRDVSHVN